MLCSAVLTRWATIAALGLTVATLPGLSAQQKPSAQTAVDARGTVDKYCAGCHNERTKSGGLALDHMDYSNVAAEAGVWEKAIKKMRVGMMPPQGAPQRDRCLLTTV